MNTAVGILIPFIEMTLGAACVFFMKSAIKPTIQKMPPGFASGVMMATSVWPLLVPVMEMSKDMGKLTFVPAAVGLLARIELLLLMNRIIPHPHLDHEEPEGVKSFLSEATILVLAATPHNIPEGMAVGVVFAGVLAGGRNIMAVEAFTLTIGIAIQSFPEGAIISIPLEGEGKSKGRVFLLGTLSGIMEPAGTVMTILLASHIVPILPYLLSFATGAMLYVVVEELIPEASEGEHTNIGALGFAAGFVITIILNMTLGQMQQPHLPAGKLTGAAVCLFDDTVYHPV